MRICILSDEEISTFNPAPFMAGYDWELVTIPATEPVMETIRALAVRNEFDVYLNLCEGYDELEEGEPGYEGVEVVKALEALNLPFTGADSKFFDPTRVAMQQAAIAHGINFVKGYHVNKDEDVENLVNNLHYPLIVKHPNSYGSTGLVKDSRVDTPEQLRTQVERMFSEFGAARVEEFIVGKEFNVLVADNPDDFGNPIAYPPAELVFPPGEEFWHVDVKWNYDVPFDFKRVTDPELIARLHDMGRRMFLAMDGVGYGRCDIRMNEKGELFILEINPNGGIMFKPEEYGPADYMILYDPEGYKGFFDRMFRAAFLRHQMRTEKA